MPSDLEADTVYTERETADRGAVARYYQEGGR